MIFERTARFRRAAKSLSTQNNERLAKALLLYEESPSHPSLGVRRIQGTKDLWEGHASASVRFALQKIDGGILLRNVGPHEATLKRP